LPFTPYPIDPYFPTEIHAKHLFGEHGYCPIQYWLYILGAIHHHPLYFMILLLLYLAFMHHFIQEGDQFRFQENLQSTNPEIIENLQNFMVLL
jgi:hypothetical protein